MQQLRLFLVMVLFGLAAPAKADLVISIGNANVVAGQAGSVNIFIKSTGTDQLGNFSFKLQITPQGAAQAAGRRMEFTNSPAAASDPTFAASDYVFQGDSHDISTSTRLGNATTTTTTRDSFIGADRTQGGMNITVTTARKLLATVPLTSITSSPPVAGDTYRIDLITDANTFFQTAVFDDVPFSSTSGTIQILNPEPSSLLLGSIAVLCGAGWYVRTRRTCRHSSDKPAPQ